MIHMLAGLGSVPQITSPFTFREGLVAEGAFRCPPGTVPNVSPSGEVIGCKRPDLANGAPRPSPWPLIIGLGAAAALAYAVWG